MRPSDYGIIKYNDITFNTGDIIFFKTYNSYIPLVKMTEFSHVGVIVIIDKIPFVLEMYNPCAYLTPLDHKLIENDGAVLYYKGLKNPLSLSQLGKIESFLKEAENIKYRKYMHQDNTEEKDNEMVCTEFVFHLLHDAGIINLAEYKGEFLLRYLADLTGKYEPTKQMVFFDAVRHYNIRQVLKKITKGMDAQGKMNEILNMPLIDGIWRKQYSKFNELAQFSVTQ